ncbi:hypothetical protein LAZ67_18001686 [Cordylochernes scorpioides]|uniref:Uncharacterized protein n=1 Tax=Cordylochernes scorpioides TaxID=51811 RepID=A0ABY6LKR4_9ARAC|nr:hypothetical protein LAZ67_18001686 [Cordylochernes scorpioides]
MEIGEIKRYALWCMMGEGMRNSCHGGIKKENKNEATWWTSSKRCCLKRSDCCLPPTPVYFLEDSGRFF